MALVVFFVINEGVEAYVDGFTQYFTNMWNLMDWSGFLLFTMLFVQFHVLRESLLDNTCNDEAYLCTKAPATPRHTPPRCGPLQSTPRAPPARSAGWLP